MVRQLWTNQRVRLLLSSDQGCDWMITVCVRVCVIFTWRFVSGPSQVDKVLEVLLYVTLLQRLPHFLIELK